MMVGGNGGASPCAACKLLRRRCVGDCIFAPYFPTGEIHKFACVHKVFGASNISKMLQELPEHQRNDAVSAMIYEANARIRDPVYGCVAAISSLQQQVDILQKQLAEAQAEIIHLRLSLSEMKNNIDPPPAVFPETGDVAIFAHHHHHESTMELDESLWSL